MSTRRRMTVREIIPAPKGGEPGTGKVGTTTITVKDALLRAFDKVGGEDYLVLLARKEPKVFAALLAKLLPTKVEADENLAAAAVQVLTGISRNPTEPPGPVLEHDPKPEEGSIH